jgi:hypothetical protein
MPKVTASMWVRTRSSRKPLGIYRLENFECASPHNAPLSRYTDYLTSMTLAPMQTFPVAANSQKQTENAFLEQLTIRFKTVELSGPRCGTPPQHNDLETLFI